MSIRGQWGKFQPADWASLAERWFASLGKGSASGDNVGQTIVMMNFTAAPTEQWAFVCEAIHCAKSEIELEHLAAGPLEHLLKRHGGEYASKVAAMVAGNENWIRALRKVDTSACGTDVKEVVTRLCDPVKRPPPSK